MKSRNPKTGKTTQRVEPPKIERDEPRPVLMLEKGEDYEILAFNDEEGEVNVTNPQTRATKALGYPASNFRYMKDLLAKVKGGEGKTLSESYRFMMEASTIHEAIQAFLKKASEVDSLTDEEANSALEMIWTEVCNLLEKLDFSKEMIQALTSDWHKTCVTYKKCLFTDTETINGVAVETSYPTAEQLEDGETEFNGISEVVFQPKGKGGAAFRLFWARLLDLRSFVMVVGEGGEELGIKEYNLLDMPHDTYHDEMDSKKNTADYCFHPRFIDSLVTINGVGQLLVAAVNYKKSDEWISVCEKARDELGDKVEKSPKNKKLKENFVTWCKRHKMAVDNKDRAKFILAQVCVLNTMEKIKRNFLKEKWEIHHEVMPETIRYEHYQLLMNRYWDTNTENTPLAKYMAKNATKRRFCLETFLELVFTEVHCNDGAANYLSKLQGDEGLFGSFLGWVKNTRYNLDDDPLALNMKQATVAKKVESRKKDFVFTEQKPVAEENMGQDFVRKS
jgi:hypothetical protein